MLVIMFECNVRMCIVYIFIVYIKDIYKTKLITIFRKCINSYFMHRRKTFFEKLFHMLFLPMANITYIC